MPSSVEASLFCIKCNRIVVDAVEVACCHSLYCESCVAVSTAEAPVRCHTCGATVDTAPTPNLPVRRLVSSIPSTCPNEGCGESLPSGFIPQHVERDCPYSQVECKHFSRGCAVTLLRKEQRKHEEEHCIFRDLPCPQGCSSVMQWRDVNMHFRDSCPKSLVDCEVNCGQLVERAELHNHMSVCPMKPVVCPYKGIGCTLRHTVRRSELADHMKCSIHAHLALTDAWMKVAEQSAFAAGPLLAHPAVHDWDPTYVQCVGKMPAQERTISAVCFVGPHLATGCEGGTLNIYRLDTGALIRSQSAGDAPVRSLAGTSSGQLLVGFFDSTVQVWRDELSVRFAVSKVHPRDVRSSKGIAAMSRAVMPKAPHLAGRLHLLHPELYAVPQNDEGLLRGDFECVAVAVEDHIRLLDLTTLDEIACVDGHHNGLVNTVVVQGSTLVTGGCDGRVFVHDTSKAGFPVLHKHMCGGANGPSVAMVDAGGVTAVCFSPLSTSGLVVGGGDGSLRFWDMNVDSTSASANDLLTIDNAHKAAVVSLVAVDGKHVVSGGLDEAMRGWDGVQDFSLFDLPCSMHAAVAAGLMLYTAGAQSSVKVWTATTCRARRAFYPPAAQPTPTAQ